MPTDISSPLPDLELAPGSTITVTLADASADVTQLNVYGVSPLTGLPEAFEVVPAMFPYGPDAE